ncbi:MAG: alpha/beta hydrolase [Bacteroidota bacterium]
MVPFAVVVFIGVALFGILLAARRVEASFVPLRIPNRRNPGSLHLPYEDVVFPTVHRKHLHGWFIRSADEGKAHGENQHRRPTVVVLHGWSRGADAMLGYARMLHRAGYHVFLFNARNHGDSDTEGHSSLLQYSEDLRSALDYVASRDDVDRDRIGLIGHSIGAAATLVVAATDSRVKAAVSLASFAHPRQLTENALRSRGIRNRAILSVILYYLQMRLGVRFDEIAPERLMSKIHVPVLLFHGDNDDVVPLEDHFRLVRAKSGEGYVESKILHGVNHTAFESHPEFEPTLLRFLESAFGPMEPSVIVQTNVHHL